MNLNRECPLVIYLKGEGVEKPQPTETIRKFLSGDYPAGAVGGNTGTNMQDFAGSAVWVDDGAWRMPALPGPHRINERTTTFP
jgi:hypothetical protein